jgi:hypothetical protein
VLASESKRRSSFCPHRGDGWGDALKGSGTKRATRGERGVDAVVVSRSRQK